MLGSFSCWYIASWMRKEVNRSCLHRERLFETCAFGTMQMRNYGQCCHQKRDSQRPMTSKLSLSRRCRLIVAYLPGVASWAVLSNLALSAL